MLAAHERGDCVIATARSLEKIQDFPKTDKIRLMQLDVTEGFQTIQEKFDRAIKFFGRVDVLVNNAGMGYKAILEEAGYVSSHDSTASCARVKTSWALLARTSYGSSSMSTSLDLLTSRTRHSRTCVRGAAALWSSWIVGRAGHQRSR